MPYRDWGIMDPANTKVAASDFWVDLKRKLIYSTLSLFLVSFWWLWSYCSYFVVVPGLETRCWLCCWIYLHHVYLWAAVTVYITVLVSLSSPFVPSFAVSSTLIYCCISVSLFSFSYSFPVLLVCCFVCLFSFVSSPVIVFICASFPSCGHFPCQSPVSCQCSVSIYSPVLPLSTHLFVSLWLCVPATQTF